MKKGMDRTSWLAAGVCLLLLILYPQIVSHFYPPDPNAAKKKAESAAATTATNVPAAAPRRLQFRSWPPKRASPPVRSRGLPWSRRRCWRTPPSGPSSPPGAGA